MSDWIKVEDKLPPLDTPVLVWHDGRPFIAELWYHYDDETEKDSTKWYISSWFDKPEIKVWKPINPPQEPANG